MAMVSTERALPTVAVNCGCPLHGDITGISCFIRVLSLGMCPIVTNRIYLYCLIGTEKSANLSVKLNKSTLKLAKAWKRYLTQGG